MKTMSLWHSGRALLLHAKGPWIKPPWGKSIFFFHFIASQVQIPAKKANYSTPFNTHATTLRTFLEPFWTTLGGQEPQESFGNRVKQSLKLILLNKKIKKVIFFKIPSFKISNTLGGSCPHIWLCNPHTRNWPKFFLDETHQYEHCDCKSSTSFDYSEPLTQKYIFVVIGVLIFIAFSALIIYRIVAPG